jgi:hypothetical protein
LDIARVFNFQITSLGHDGLCGERSLGIPPPRVRPPLLDVSYLVKEDLLFSAWVDGHVVHLVGSHV